MFKVDHAGIQMNLPLDPATLTGDIATDLALSYITGLDAGVLVGVDTDGYVKLSTGTDISTGITPIGMLINSAAPDNIYENVPSLASRKVSVMLGKAVVYTDKTAAVTINAGDLLWSDANGFVTNVPITAPTDGDPEREAHIGIALLDCAGSGAELKMILL
jgi:hypothetical protein